MAQCAQPARSETIAARALVNAAGPWISEVMTHRLGTTARPALRLVKGSHIAVPKLFDHDRAYIFQNADGRIVFAIPYEREFTLIGTTDVDFAGDLDHVSASAEEIAYLCGAVSEYFVRAGRTLRRGLVLCGRPAALRRGDVSAQEATRDFVLEHEGRAGEPPVLNIFGGKITTFRHLAEEALKKLAAVISRDGRALDARLDAARRRLRASASATSSAGDLAAAFPFLDPPLDRRASSQPTGPGPAASSPAPRQLSDLGAHFGQGLYEREVEHLVRNEWAASADDILWRRTKLGLRMSEAERSRLADWFAARDAAFSAA